MITNAHKMSNCLKLVHYIFAWSYGSINEENWQSSFFRDNPVSPFLSFWFFNPLLCHTLLDTYKHTHARTHTPCFVLYAITPIWLQRMYVCVRVCVSVSVCVCGCVYICVCVCMYVWGLEEMNFVCTPHLTSLTQN